MASDLAAHLRDIEDNEPIFYVPMELRAHRWAGPRRHVVSRMIQERSGRLYFNEETDVEIPGLEIYAAR